jgi:P27 family predicted phage terminase small subunit
MSSDIRRLVHPFTMAPLRRPLSNQVAHVPHRGIEVGGQSRWTALPVGFVCRQPPNFFPKFSMPSHRSEFSKLLAGTSRSDRDPKSDPAARLMETPEAPEYLSDNAKIHWCRVAPAAVALGTLSEADFAAFALLCETLATAEEARTVVARDGFLVPTENGGQKAHAAIKVLETARNQARGLLSDFGLSPRGRQGVDVLPAPAEPSLWDEFLDRRIENRTTS